VLELKGLTRRYDDLVALDDLSFTAAEGQLFGFAGPNGAGKTTAMRIVLGVLEPDAGQRVGSMPGDHG
jgi:ABC-2 type transport system ATP-binding protein